MIRSHHASIRGFTLIEVMVVIVIMSIMASLVVLNISGVDQRKAMQAREVLLLDLQRILRESMISLVFLRLMFRLPLMFHHFATGSWNIAPLIQQNPL